MQEELIKVSNMVVTQVDGECSYMTMRQSLKRELIKVLGTYEGGW